MLKRTFAQKMKSTIQRMADGNLTMAVTMSGTPYQRSALAALEQLRRNLLLQQDERNSIDEKNKTAVASVAHDLKTPLAVISGYAESMRDGMDDKDYLGLIMQKTEQMNDLVLSLVDAAQQVQGDKEERIEKIGAKEFFGVEFTKYYPLAKDRNIRLKVRTAPNVHLYMNRQKLSRLVQNVVTNAIKYTPQGGKVSVRFVRQPHFLYITVKDNGIGISKDNLPFIFDKFFMADSSRTATTSTKSSGLGLYIAKEIAEQYGGTIEVHSKEDKGSKFTIVLPVENDIFTPTQNNTERLDALPKSAKFTLWFFFGYLMTWIYRFMKYSETRHKSTLAAAFVLFPMFILGWFADLISIAITNELTLLVE